MIAWKGSNNVILVQFQTGHTMAFTADCSKISPMGLPRGEPKVETELDSAQRFLVAEALNKFIGGGTHRSTAAEQKALDTLFD